jgi:hypothetical protein
MAACNQMTEISFLLWDGNFLKQWGKNKTHKTRFHIADSKSYE